MLLILAVVLGLFLIASCLPIWCIKWKYEDPSKASLPSVNYDNVPTKWMRGEEKNMMLWTIMFGRIKTVKTIQSYTKVYSCGGNIKTKIGLFS